MTPGAPSPPTASVRPARSLELAGRYASTVACTLAIAALLAGCMPPPKKARSSEEEENAKAFAELEKNDKDETSGKTKDKGADEKREKGPVFPAPFTAEQLRDATKNGRTYRYKVELPNKAPTEYTVTFRKVDENGAEIHRGDSTKRLGWLALQQDAEFPKDKTTTHKEKLKTPAGKFDCVVYEVTEDDGDVWSFFFAKKLPGAPVFFYVERNGRRLRTTTLIEHLPGK